MDIMAVTALISSCLPSLLKLGILTEKIAKVNSRKSRFSGCDR
jgi:hypothetical protein